MNIDHSIRKLILIDFISVRLPNGIIDGIDIELAFRREKKKNSVRYHPESVCRFRQKNRNYNEDRKKQAIPQLINNKLEDNQWCEKKFTVCSKNKGSTKYKTLWIYLL